MNEYLMELMLANTDYTEEEIGEMDNWKQVDITKLQEILGTINKVVEDEDYDDDCGWQYSYKFV